MLNKIVFTSVCPEAVKNSASFWLISNCSCVYEVYAQNTQMTASYSCLKSIFCQTAVALGCYHGDRKGLWDRKDWCVYVFPPECVSLKEQLPNTGYSRCFCFFFFSIWCHAHTSQPRSTPPCRAVKSIASGLVSIWTWHFRQKKHESYLVCFFNQHLAHLWCNILWFSKRHGLTTLYQCNPKTGLQKLQLIFFLKMRNTYKIDNKILFF